MLTPQERKAKVRSVVRVASGNFLEMYDFMVYGYYAKAIATEFFPSQSEIAVHHEVVHLEEVAAGDADDGAESGLAFLWCRHASLLHSSRPSHARGAG